MALTDLDVLVLDCQATGASPRGQLLEVGWARSTAACAGPPEIESHAVAPEGPLRLPRRVRELTGLTARELKAAPPRGRVGERLAAVVGETAGDAPWVGVAHFARFEARPHLGSRVFADGDTVSSSVKVTPLEPDPTPYLLGAWESGFGDLEETGGSMGVSFDITQPSGLAWRYEPLLSPVGPPAAAQPAAALQAPPACGR